MVPLPLRGAASLILLLVFELSTTFAQLIPEIASTDARISQFNEAIIIAGLSETLGEPGPLTVFAPDNTAFSTIDFEKYRDPQWRDHLIEILTLHVSPIGSLLTADMTLGQQIPTLLGSPLTVTSTGPYTVRGISLVAPDIVATNGVIHIIDDVALPPSAEDSVLDIVNVIPNFFSIISELITEAGLEETLQGPGPFTLFAPSNEAFNSWEDSALEAVRTDPEVLSNFLLYHVVPGIYTSESLNGVTTLTTLSSQELPNPLDFMNIPDILASNGIIHIMETVLVPPEGSTAVPLPTEPPVVETLTPTAGPQPDSPAPTVTPAAGTPVAAPSKPPVVPPPTQPVFDPANFPDSGSILELLQANGAFNTLLSGLNQTSDFLGLNDTGTWTVFAPTNFSALPPTFFLPDWNAHLVNVLSYHVLRDQYLAADLTQGLSLRALTSNNVTVTSAPDPLQINNVSVISADHQADNGVIHVVDQVILPVFAMDDAMDFLEGFPVFSTLVSLLNSTGLTGALRGSGPLTVFAPDNTAFNNLPKETLNQLLNDTDALRDVLLYHVVPDIVDYLGLVNETNVTTLQGQNLTIGPENNTVSGVSVRFEDLLVRNGLVHVLGEVLVPPPSQEDPGEEAGDPDIVDAVLSQPDNFSTLARLLDIANLTQVLRGEGPFTVFAPTNAAFDALPPGVLDSLSAKAGPLADVLLYHVVDGTQLLSSDFSVEGVEVPTAQGQFITVTSVEPLIVNEANVVAGDLVVSNGVIHVIDAVLLPPDDATLAPTGAPETPPPTQAAVTEAPTTVVLETAPPTQAAVTEAPTGAPETPPPTQAAITESPTTGVLETASPTQAAVTPPPTQAPGLIDIDIPADNDSAVDGPAPAPTPEDGKCVGVPGIQVCCPPGEADGIYFFCRFL